jgi:hypothetical protein
MTPVDSLPNTSPPTKASWLLGEPVTLTELQPSELSLEPIRADAMILLQSDESILHSDRVTSYKTGIEISGWLQLAGISYKCGLSPDKI